MKPMGRNRQFPWYDGNWLEQFVLAQSYIDSHHPDVLPRFLEAMAPLRTDPAFQTQYLRDVLDDTILAHVRDVIARLKPTQLELHEIKAFGRWVVHDHPVLTELQGQMTALAEQVAGEALEPSYNFLSMYTRMGRCPMHQDSPSAKWTLDLCIDQSDPWEIHFSQVLPWPEHTLFAEAEWQAEVLNNPDNRFISHSLMPGDAVLFSGSSQWHYRDPIPSQGSKGFCHLLFFHFIPRGMRKYLDAAEWETLFGVAGLSEALGNLVKQRVSREASV